MRHALAGKPEFVRTVPDNVVNVDAKLIPLNVLKLALAAHVVINIQEQQVGTATANVRSCSTDTLVVTSPSQLASGVQSISVTNPDGQVVTVRWSTSRNWKGMASGAMAALGK